MSALLFYAVLSIILILASLFPFIKHPYWVFRASEFLRVQVLVLQLVLFVWGFFLDYNNPYTLWPFQFILFGFIVFHSIVLSPYILASNKFSKNPNHNSSKSIDIISYNVYQLNKEYQKFIDLINNYQPDLILTMESNKDWENAMEAFEVDYPYHQKIALENTYGMHFYSKIKINKIDVNYYMADDMPSIEAELTTDDNFTFSFFGVHPPPPSPTEEPNSKERDGELLTIGKKARKCDVPLIVVGDFNNVAWSQSARLFRKISGLIDPRIGRGFYSTFHAKYKLLRFPIDLFFHSNSIHIEEFRTLDYIGSDHLPLYCRFYMDAQVEDKPVEKVEREEIKLANEMIQEGILEVSNRPAVVRD